MIELIVALLMYALLSVGAIAALAAIMSAFRKDIRKSAVGFAITGAVFLTLGIAVSRILASMQ